MKPNMILTSQMGNLLIKNAPIFQNLLESLSWLELRDFLPGSARIVAFFLQLEIVFFSSKSFFLPLIFFLISFAFLEDLALYFHLFL